MLLAHTDPVSFAGTIGVVLGMCALVIVGSARVAPRVSGRALALLGAGLALSLLAVSPTVDHLAEERLAWHMVQHLLLTVGAPPLLVLARPGRLLTAGLPRSARRRMVPLLRVGTRIGLAQRSRLVVGVGLVSVVVLWVWHVPFAYDAALEQPLLHGLEHVTLFLSAAASWWFVLDRRSPAPSALLSVLVVVVASGALGSLLTFAPRPIYDTYASQDAALTDQQLAGLLMWIPGGLPYLTVAVVLTVRMLTPTERSRAPAVSAASVAS